ncbi:hypothetical protein N0V85_004797 [Neurospora sp. IMI 360204]|nr:hypothetical protein N0V85_004797 [Neurospora sp. IMI 360204]
MITTVNTASTPTAPTAASNAKPWNAPLPPLPPILAHPEAHRSFPASLTTPLRPSPGSGSGSGFGFGLGTGKTQALGVAQHFGSRVTSWLLVQHLVGKFGWQFRIKPEIFDKLYP